MVLAVGCHPFDSGLSSDVAVVLKLQVNPIYVPSGCLGDNIAARHRSPGDEPPLWFNAFVLVKKKVPMADTASTLHEVINKVRGGGIYDNHLTATLSA